MITLKSTTLYYKYVLIIVSFFVLSECFCFQNNYDNNTPSKSSIITLLDSIEIAVGQANDSLTLSLINRALEFCEALSEDSLKAKILLHKSNYHLKRQEKEEGLKLIFEYININDSLENLINLANGYYKLAAYYYWNNEFERALEYAILMLKTIPDTQKNQKQIAKSNMVIGTILQELDRLGESMQYQNKALEIKRALNLVSDIPISLSNIAHTYLKLGDTILAINKFKKSIHIADSLGLLLDLNFGTFSLGCVYYELGNYEDSRLALEQVIEEWEEINSQKDLLRAYPMLAKTYTELSLYREAAQTLNKFIVIKDKAFDETKIGYQEELEKKFKIKKKELENLELKVSNRTYQKTVNVIGIVAIIFSLLTILLSLFYYQIRKVKRKLADQNLIIEDQNSQLIKLDQLKSRFFNNVTHELRTPLTLMLGPIGSALHSGLLNRKNEGFLRMAQKSGQNLLRLVGEILDLSKMESGKMILNNEPIHLKSFFNRLFAQYESYANQKGIKMSFIYEAKSDLQLMLDVNKFEKIYNNLLSNALKFTVDGDDIQIFVKDLGADLRLSVYDSGPGIHQDDLPNVFDRYYQSMQPDASIQGGTGIGLALSKEFVLLFKGQIWVESEFGEYTRFILDIPKIEVPSTIPTTLLKYPNRNEKGQEEELVEVLNTNKTDTGINILVVEDNLDLGNYLKLILRDYYRIDVANNGQQALDLLNQSASSNDHKKIISYDLIISDVMMPVMDGFEFLEHLKSHRKWREIPVVMLTARAALQDKLTALRIGVDDYMLKPFEEEELLARVHNLLKHFAERKKLDLPIKEESSQALEVEGDKDWLAKLEYFTVRKVGDFNLTADVLATEMSLSRTQFFRRIKKCTGLTPTQYVKEIRFNCARTLLEKQTFSNVKTVAFEVGFKQVKHFSQEFKRRYGKSPSSYL